MREYKIIKFIKAKDINSALERERKTKVDSIEYLGEIEEELYSPKKNKMGYV